MYCFDVLWIEKLVAYDFVTVFYSRMFMLTILKKEKLAKKLKEMLENV